ncbi:hypothetical protein GS854_01180 [Rhodococcus hoagii]|nr:hypothetical protein [Prescottella equi]NKT91692.1 hypothetical protein [Prescottella equi]NKW61828.1 hypothetical protein [Prescottella equi]
MISSEGYSEVLDANASGAQTYRELMWCARAAAYACVLLSRGDVGDSSYLAQVTFWKNAEGQMAGALGSTVGQAMAEFHAKRAIALSGGMVEQEVRELRHVVDVLLENYVDNTEYDAFDLIKFHDLTFIITRLYVTDWAYRSERGNEELVERFFPEGVDVLIAKLRRIYDSGDRMAASEDEKVAALIRLRATYECISRHLGGSAGRGLRHPLDTDLIEDIKNVDVTDFLRVEDAKIVQAIVFARYVLACIHLDTPMFELDQTRMILTALDFCQAGIRVTRDAGTGKTMRDVAQRVQRELLASLEGADVEQLRQSRREQLRDEDRRNRFRKTRHQINTLVMTAITASPMTGVEAKHVANTADAVSAYLNSTMLRRSDDR